MSAVVWTLAGFAPSRMNNLTVQDGMMREEGHWSSSAWSPEFCSALLDLVVCLDKWLIYKLPWRQAVYLRFEGDGQRGHMGSSPYHWLKLEVYGKASYMPCKL